MTYSRSVQKLDCQGLTIAEIMKSTGLGRASVCANSPYKIGAYNLKEPTRHSGHGKRYSARKAAVKAREEQKVIEAAMDALDAEVGAASECIDIQVVYNCRGGDAPLGAVPPPAGYNEPFRTRAGAANRNRARFPRTRWRPYSCFMQRNSF